MTDAELGAFVRAKMREATKEKADIYARVPNISGSLNPMEGARDKAMQKLMQETLASIAEAAGVE